MRQITIGSRRSALALTQTDWVKKKLETICPDCQFTVKEIQTQGDQILDRSLAKIGGKGLFIKEIEQALLDEEIDLAVHSMKDMPVRMPEGLIIGAVSEREDPRDALISPHKSLAAIPVHGCIGTSSLRRKAQLLAIRPDLRVVSLRGNINTRLHKLAQDNLDGILLAAAGLHRMDWQDKITQYLNPIHFIPAVGQGALAIQIRVDEPLLQSWVNQINHEETSDAVIAERGFLEAIEGSCQVPVGAYAQCSGSLLSISGFIGSVDGKQMVRKELVGERIHASVLGVELARSILADGGEDILDVIKWELKAE